MVTRKSKSVVDNLLESVYSETLVTVNSYEQSIVEIMIDLDCTLSQALDVNFDMHNIDKTSVLSLVEYLESRLNRNMYKVNLMMQIYTNQLPDYKLKPLT
jgi:hypothetical protein